MITKCKEHHDVAHRLLESHTVSNTASFLGGSRMTIQYWRMPRQHTRKASDKKPGRPFELTGYLAKKLRCWDLWTWGSCPDVLAPPGTATQRLRRELWGDLQFYVSRRVLNTRLRIHWPSAFVFLHVCDIIFEAYYKLYVLLFIH